MVFDDNELKVKDVAHIVLNTMTNRSDIIRQKFENIPINILTEPYTQGKYDDEIIWLIGSQHSFMDKNVLSNAHIFYYYDPYSMLTINTKIIVRMSNRIKL